MRDWKLEWEVLNFLSTLSDDDDDYDVGVGLEMSENSFANRNTPRTLSHTAHIKLIPDQ